jgi:hypothetical protein
MPSQAVQIPDTTRAAMPSGVIPGTRAGVGGGGEVGVASDGFEVTNTR